MRSQTNFRFIRWTMIGALLAAAILSLHSATGQERGQTVRLRIGAATTGQEVELYGASYALVIGVSDYTNGWHDLPGVRDDVPAVKAALEKHGFKVTTVLNPTRRQFDDVVRQFVGAYGQGRNNRLLIYFAGHGHTLKTQDGRRELGYIIPADAPKANDTGEFKSLAVSMNDINNYAEQIEAIHALFVFDSCFAGTIFKSRSSGVPEAITDKIVQPVRQFITAGNEKQAVPDYSYFRRAFIAALDGAADDNRDGFITGTELGEYLHREVTNYTKRAQTPQHGKIYNPDLNEGDLVFVAPKREPVTLVGPCVNEEEAWKRLDSQSVAAVQAFLREYPNCQYAANARILLATLEGARNRPSGSNPSPVPSTTLTPVIALPRGVDPSRLAVHNFQTASVDAKGNVRKFTGSPTQQYIEDLGNGVRLEMVAVRGGTFTMGSADGRVDEKPPHQVAVSDFWMGKFELTQAQWRVVMGTDPSGFKGDDLPVESVSWYDAKEFCSRLNAKLSLSEAEGYRLPSEAEWEYATRAGSKTKFAFGETISPEIVNYMGDAPFGEAQNGVYRQRTLAVGSLGVANAWGLFDLHGNVWEWCEDDWHSSYSGASTDGRAWVDIPDRASDRVNRGGGWINSAVSCQSADRIHDS
ncbi:MAG TPA: SUMF1/EgtB/PvdO family nonheme iron enzyme, partial [Blastocatellia bacterium]|nr:SUMF1/EgtB/PvdO family nonheme iron enzyme [Blastocatellia bacterium]